MTQDPIKLSRILKAPAANIAVTWPKVKACLDSLGCGSENNYIAALATIRVECPSFLPQSEQYDGDPETYFTKMYWDNEHDRRELGNLEPGDGARFRGRGFVQITGRWDYDHFGKLLGIDLVNHPEKALDPDISASIFAAFWKERKCNVFADAGNWVGVRRIVNGGTNELAGFVGYINALRSVEIGTPRVSVAVPTS